MKFQSDSDDEFVAATNPKIVAGFDSLPVEKAA